MKASKTKAKKNKFNLSSENSLGKIKVKKENIDQTLLAIKMANKNNVRHIKKLNASVSIKQRDLAKLEHELKLQTNTNKIVISEKLERLFEIAKGLKPELSREIDQLLLKKV